MTDALSRLYPVTASEPVAWRVKNDFGHWYVTADKRIADTYRDIEKLDVQPLYLGVAQRHPFGDWWPETFADR